MNQYPEINPGDGFGSVSARQWRQLMQEHKELQRAVFGDGNVQRTASGIRINERKPTPLLPIPGKTVVITKKPVDGDTSLTVREAKYVNLLPKPCTGTGTSAVCFYEWHGTEFDVYPPLGTNAVDFAGDENTEAVTVPPKLTTKFHRIHREHDVWVAEKAATGSTSDVCLIHAGEFGTNWNGSFVRVVHMKPNASATAFISAESTVPIPPATTALGYSLVRCWPGTDGNFWQYLQSTTGSAPTFVPSATAVYVGTQTIRGVEYVAPIFPINMFAPNTALPAGDC